MKILGIPHVSLGGMYDSLRVSVLARRLSNDAKAIMLFYSVLSPELKRKIDILGWMCFGTENDIILPLDIVDVLNDHWFQKRFWEICSAQREMPLAA